MDAISREFPWAQVAALGRACTLDVERAAQSLKHARRPRIHTFIATSDIHLKYKLKKSRQQVLEEAVAAVELARQYVDDVEFSAEDGARTDPDFLELISRAVVAAGARTVNIPDTVGYSVPFEYAGLIGRIVKALGDCAVVSVHCHDDLGLATANSIAAVEAGARQIECTINGIGERAGNTALEEVVMLFKTRQDRLPYDTGIRTEHLYSASQLLAFHDHLRPATEQGDRGAQRLRARGRHPSGWLPERKDHLRDHGPALGGRAGKQAGAGQTQRPPRAEETHRRPGLRPEQGRAAIVVRAVHGSGRQQEGPAGRRDRRAD